MRGLCALEKWHLKITVVIIMLKMVMMYICDDMILLNAAFFNQVCQ